MLTRVCLAMTAFGVVVAGCTTTSNAPATAPPTTSSPSSTTSVTTGSILTTTTAATTTTTADRIAEIAAIFEDIERRRLQAIYDQDEEAFRAVHANEEYGRRSLVIFEQVKVSNPAAAHVTIVEVFVDSPACIAALTMWDKTDAIVDGGVGTAEEVVELRDGIWALSWIGTGWRCDGSHPLDG